MCLKGERLKKADFPFIKFLLIIFAMGPVIFLSGACTKEDSSEVQDGKLITQVKKAIPKPPVLSNQEESEKAKEENRDLQSPIPAAQPETPHQISGGDGHYIVQAGDSLIKIAAREEVYNDPFKWTSLFRMNMNKLKGIETAADLRNQELPEGLDLRFVTTSEAKENQSKLGSQVYTTNVLSVETSEKIVSWAIILMKNGYTVYISTATVKGKQWLRLRAGFFNTYEEALTAGEHIKSILDGTKIWVARVNADELKQFGGY